MGVYDNRGWPWADNRNIRHRSSSGYNYGLRWQCVEFVKRYYADALGHEMPDTYGHAISFFDPSVADGEINQQRGLQQHTNPSAAQPAPGDLLVFDAWILNPYGHVAIISARGEDWVEIVQQNAWPVRKRLPLTSSQGGTWQIEHERVMGWLRQYRKVSDQG